MTSVRSAAAALASLPSAAAGVLDRRRVARVSKRCIEYGIRRPSVGAGFRCSYQRERRRLFQDRQGARSSIPQTTTERPRSQAQQRDRTWLELLGYTRFSRNGAATGDD